MNIDGVVVVFDEARGDGMIRDTRGQEFYFHCVHLMDASRFVALGAPVSARRVVGLRGRDEAADIVKL